MNDLVSNNEEFLWLKNPSQLKLANKSSSEMICVKGHKTQDPQRLRIHETHHRTQSIRHKPPPLYLFYSSTRGKMGSVTLLYRHPFSVKGREDFAVKTLSQDRCESRPIIEKDSLTHPLPLFKYTVEGLTLIKADWLKMVLIATAKGMGGLILKHARVYMSINLSAAPSTMAESTSKRSLGPTSPSRFDQRKWDGSCVATSLGARQGWTLLRHVRDGERCGTERDFGEMRICHFFWTGKLHPSYQPCRQAGIFAFCFSDRLSGIQWSYCLRWIFVHSAS